MSDDFSTKTEVKYGLWHKKKKCLLTFSTTSNDGADFCIDISYSLGTYGDQVWLVDDALTAEYVRNHSTEWYNADYETPNHDLDPEDVVVVEVKVVTDVHPVGVVIPTMEEYLKLKYKKSDPGHYEYCLKELKRYPEMKYSLYDLMELVEKGKWNKGEVK